MSSSRPITARDWPRRVAGRRRPAAAALGAALLAALAGLTAGCFGDAPRWLGDPEVVAQGIRLYRPSDSTLLDDGGPIAVQMLRLDPARVELRSALSQGEVMGTETVLDTAERAQAVAAINAGFFLPNGDPTGVLQIDGQLVSDSARPRGAVAVGKQGNRTTLTFDIITVRATLKVETPGGLVSVPIAGIDTVRQRGKLMLFTPLYHVHTDTAARGIEWVLDGSPLSVRERRVDVGSTPIPRSGFVLSYGGLEPPGPLAELAAGAAPRIDREYISRHGTPADLWARATHVIGGAGLLIREGRPVEGWQDEDIRTGFDTERHPRTVIGVDRSGTIWLVTVDGRNPMSLGMTFRELQRLASRLELRDALNLDGGGSTTMVVKGQVVNHPSDAAGPRKVSDSILVFAR
jgi:exopolysaccharide biosynthesis protein